MKLNEKLQQHSINKNELHVSYSQLNTYILCPMKYGHHYVWGTPAESIPFPLLFGSAIHRAVEYFYRFVQVNGSKPPSAEVEDFFTENLNHQYANAAKEVRFKRGGSFEQGLDQGKALMQLFHHEIQPREIVGLEVPFSVDFPDLLNGASPHAVKLVGYFDLVETDEQGTPMVVELKTAAQKFSDLRLNFDLQPTVYSYSMSKMGISDAESTAVVRYDVLLKTKKPVFETYFVNRLSCDHDRLIHLLNQVLLAIEARIFYRNQGWMCLDCQYQRACLGNNQ